MKVSPQGIAFLVAHEGIVPAPYFDSVGVLTYGIGHTAAAGEPNPASLPRGMPDDLDAGLRDAFDVFRRDLDRYAADVERAFTVPLNQHEFDAAVSFHFNTGAIGRATWVNHVNAGRRTSATASIMNWRKPAEIIPRREAERDLFFAGDYGNTRATVWNVTEAGRVVWKPARTLDAAEIVSLLGREASPTTPDEALAIRLAATEEKHAAMKAEIAAILEKY